MASVMSIPFPVISVQKGLGVFSPKKSLQEVAAEVNKQSREACGIPEPVVMAKPVVAMAKPVVAVAKPVVAVAKPVVAVAKPVVAMAKKVDHRGANVARLKAELEKKVVRPVIPHVKTPVSGVVATNPSTVGDEAMAIALARELMGVAGAIHRSNASPIYRPFRKDEFPEFLHWITHCVEDGHPSVPKSIKELSLIFFAIKADRQRCGCGKTAKDLNLVN